MNTEFSEAIAAVPYVVLCKDGDHYLAGSRCGACGVSMIGHRIACAACGETVLINHVRLADTARVRTCTVISRSYSGVPVPFIAAVVELDGGGVLRGTLKDAIPEDPVTIVGMPVRISIEDTGQRDENDRPYFAHTFRPMEARS